MPRRIVVAKDDVLVVAGYEIDASVLETVLNPHARLLWAFIAKDGCLQPAAYSEQQVIWLEPSDFTYPDLK